MNIHRHILTLFVLVTLSACSDSGTETEISPREQTINGLPSVIIDDQPYMFSKVKDDARYWTVQVLLKRSDADAFYEPGFTPSIELLVLDESGRPLSGMGKLAQTDEDAWTDFLSTSGSEEIWVKFSGLAMNDDNQASEAASFRIDSRGGTLASSRPEIIEEVSDPGKSRSVTYVGRMEGGQLFKARLSYLPDGTVTGDGYSTKNVPLVYKGTFFNEVLEMTELVDGKVTGNFTGAGSPEGGITGTWFSRDYSSSASFSLTPLDNAESMTQEASTSSPISTGSGSTSCDEMVNEYDRFTDEYIAAIEKAADGDMTAMSDLQELQQSSERLGRKIEAMKGDWSGKCMDRYMRVLNKYQQAATRIGR